MPQPKWLIYGANGYTGELIAREAQKRKMTPVLAGRNALSVTRLAKELGFEFRIFDLNNVHEIVKNLANIQLVLHCAGPFSSTSAPMVQGCLQNKSHYLDITGEIGVFENIRSQQNEAVKQGIVIMPGSGFDVVPTDCLALTLKESMPDATDLILAFQFSGGPSVGTARTGVESLHLGGKVRQDGRIISVPFAYKFKKIPFSKQEKWAVTIPWGDVSTAYYTTGIHNIETYMAIPTFQIGGMYLARLLQPIFGIPTVQNLLKKGVDKFNRNPSQFQRERTKSYLWGQVTNAKGEKLAATLTTVNGYDLTATASLGIVEKLLSKNSFAGGVFTPAKFMGSSYITQLPGSTLTMQAQTI